MMAAAAIKHIEVNKSELTLPRLDRKHIEVNNRKINTLSICVQHDEGWSLLCPAHMAILFFFLSFYILKTGMMLKASKECLYSR